MAEAFELEELQEKVILVGVSEQEGDDAEDSLVELACQDSGSTGGWNIDPEA